MSENVTDQRAERFASELTDDEARAVWAALVAQVKDVHAPVWSLTETEHAAAEAVFDRLDRDAGRTVLGSAVLKSLLYPVHDLDHTDLTEDEWSAADALLAALNH